VDLHLGEVRIIVVNLLVETLLIWSLDTFNLALPLFLAKQWCSRGHTSFSGLIAVFILMFLW